MGTALPWLCFAIVAFGCGGAELREATHEDFRSVQRHEAEIEVAITAIQRRGTPRDEKERALTDMRAARGAICAVAEETLDTDLAARCRSAERRVEAAEFETTGTANR